MSGKEQVKQEEEKKWSYWAIGLAVFTVYTLALMFILEVALHPRDSLIGAIIAYVLGLLGVIGFSILVRKKTRILLSFPILLLIVFGAGYLLHLANAPIYNPFAPLSERLDVTMDTLNKVYNDPNLSTQLNISLEPIMKYQPLFVVADVILAIPLFLLGTIGIAWFANIFTSKPKLWTIVAVLLALFLVITGVLIFPYIQIITSGLVGFMGNVIAGGAYVVDGASVLDNFENATQEEINQAVIKFDIASSYFEKSANDLKTLKALGLVGLIGLVPHMGSLTNGLYSVVQAALDIAGGLAPFTNGTYNVLVGLKEAMSAFQGSTLLLQQSTEYSITKGVRTIDDNLFNEGVNRLNEGLIILSDSITNIESAIDRIKSVDFEQIYSDLDNMPVNMSDAKEQIKMLEEYINIFDGATTGIKVLIKKPLINGTESEYTIFTHFVYGAYNLFKAGDYIGKTSSFNGTSGFLTEASSNFSVVYTELLSPEIQNLAHSDTPLINDTFNFLTDVTGLSLSLTNLGKDAASIFNVLNGTLSAFDVGYENITNYDVLKAQLANIIAQTSQLTNDATPVDGNITLIYNKAQNNEYGHFNEPALDFSSQLKEFNITRDIQNANAIAHSFYYLFSGMEYLKYTYNNITNGFSEFQANNFANADQDFSDANVSLYITIGYLNSSITYMNQALQNGMTQLQGAMNALVTIRDGLMNVITDISDILTIVNGPDPGAHATEVQQKVNSILNTLKDVNNQLQNVTAQ